MKIEWNSIWEEFSTLLGTCRHTCSVTHLRLTVCDPTNYSPLGSSVRGIFQVTHLEWVAMPSSRGIPDPGIKPASPASLAFQVASLLLSHRGGPLAHSRPSVKTSVFAYCSLGTAPLAHSRPSVKTSVFAYCSLGTAPLLGSSSTRTCPLILPLSIPAAASLVQDTVICHLT